MKLLQEIMQSRNLVLALDSGVYKDSIVKINKGLSGNFERIAYISLTNTAEAILEDFRKNGIDPGKYCIIDCVSKKSSISPATSQCIYIPAPDALMKLDIAISDLLESKKMDAVFFDSISSLLIYNRELASIKFLHSMMNKVKASGAKAVYLILGTDLERDIMKELELFAEKVVNYEDMQ